MLATAPAGVLCLGTVGGISGNVYRGVMLICSLCRHVQLHVLEDIPGIRQNATVEVVDG